MKPSNYFVILSKSVRERYGDELMASEICKDDVFIGS